MFLSDLLCCVGGLCFLVTIGCFGSAAMIFLILLIRIRQLSGYLTRQSKLIRMTDGTSNCLRRTLPTIISTITQHYKKYNPTFLQYSKAMQGFPDISKRTPLKQRSIAIVVWPAILLQAIFQHRTSMGVMFHTR